jgi:hypothetical protein
VKKQLLYVVIFSLGLLISSGCTPQTHMLMPPVQYSKPITFHVAKKAYLYWDSGAQYSHELQAVQPASIGIVAGTIASMIDAQNRKNNPSKYHFLYGNAQQAIFMTSLKDILNENHVFDEIEIITDLSTAKPENILIKINFELTRVLENRNIILDVRMDIQHNKQQFERNYFIQSDEEVSSFKEKQVNVSDKLMQKIIAGIKQWSKQKK